MGSTGLAVGAGDSHHIQHLAGVVVILVGQCTQLGTQARHVADGHLDAIRQRRQILEVVEIPASGVLGLRHVPFGSIFCLAGLRRDGHDNGGRTLLHRLRDEGAAILAPTMQREEGITLANAAAVGNETPGGRKMLPQPGDQFRRLDQALEAVRGLRHQAPPLPLPGRSFSCRTARRGLPSSADEVLGLPLAGGMSV